MTTEIIITGTGTPTPTAGRAGPGVMIRCDDTLLQVDAGGGTAMRLADAEIGTAELTAVLLTHHHSDHMIGLADVIMSRWTTTTDRPCTALPLHCPDGPAVAFVETLFDHLQPDIQDRKRTDDPSDEPRVGVLPFTITGPIERIAEYGPVLVEATLVEHGDLTPAVAYRFTTPDGIVVVSGDTTACPSLQEFASGADVLVQDVVSTASLIAQGVPLEQVERIARYHADAPSVATLAAGAGVKLVMLTHFIPAPVTTEDEQGFMDELRNGGFAGQILVARDLDFVQLGGDPTVDEPGTG